MNPRKINIPLDMTVGTISDSNQCGKFEIIEYTNRRTVKVRFLKTSSEYIVMSKNIRTGAIKDAMQPSVYGIGILGIGSYSASNNGVKTEQYMAWSRMIERCYSERNQKRQPCYIGCTVCDEWHNFQSFAKWHDANYIKGFQLDKDIIKEGNKVYSPDLCKYVTQKENVAKATAKAYSFISPEGIIVNIFNLTQFCRDNDLSKDEMYKVNGMKKTSHKGWAKSF